MILSCLFKSLSPFLSGVCMFFFCMYANTPFHRLIVDPKLPLGVNVCYCLAPQQTDDLLRVYLTGSGNPGIQQVEMDGWCVKNNRIGATEQWGVWCNLVLYCVIWEHEIICLFSVSHMCFRQSVIMLSRKFVHKCKANC